VVFDGRGAPGDPESRRTPLFEAIYSHGEGGADRRILDEARRRLAEGAAVTVVTNDMRTLANALPRAAVRLRVHAFWLEHIERPAAEEEKPVAAGFSDLERAMLALEPEPPPRRRRATGSPGAAGGAARDAPHGAAGDPASTMESPPRSAGALREETLLRKRERGRRRQERLLKRRPKS
jgi:hypothetical protein